MQQWIGRGLRILALLLGLAVGLLALVVALSLPLNLNALRPRLAAAAASALGRPVEIRGDVRVVPALWPTLGVHRVRVGQPEGFPSAGPYFARFERARVQIDLLSLLRGEIRIGEVEIAGAHLALETSADGRNNWAFGAGASKPADSDATESDAAGPALLEIRALELDDVEVTYREGSTGRDYRLDIDALAGSLDPDELRLAVEGTAEGHEISLDLRADELGELRRGYEPWELDVEGLVAAIPLTGHAVVELRTDDTRIDVQLEARQSEIGELIALLTGREDVEGRFRRLELRAATAGADLHDWVEAAEVGLGLSGASLSYGNEAGARPVAFTLEQADLDLAPGGPVVASAQGSLLQEPLRLRFRGGPAVDLLDGLPWPLDLEGEGAGGTLRLTGRTAGHGPGEPPQRLRLEVEGQRLGDLAPWLSVPQGAPSAYRLRGDVEVGPEAYTLSATVLELGRTRADAELDWPRSGGAPTPRVRLHVETFHTEELRANLAKGPEAGRANSPGLTIDSPVLPERISIRDLDLGVRMDRVRLRSTDVTDVAFSARVRDSSVERAPFRAHYAGVDFRGELDLSLAEEAPAAALRVATGSLDVGNLARALGFAADLDARAERFALDLRLKGRTARELLTSAAFEAVAEEGVWRVESRLLREELRFERVHWHARPRGAIGSAFDGELRGVPLLAQAELPSLLDLAQPDYVFPARMRVEAAGARLDLLPRLKLPIRHALGDVGFELTGERLADLGPLLDVSLPPFGPYAVEGKLVRRSEGYDVRYDLRVRDSRLTGTTRLERRNGKPFLVAALEAPRIQLADFRAGDWSPVEAGSGAPTAARGSLARAEPLLSHDVLNRFDGEVGVQVGEVLSGDDSLGRGNLEATLRDGRLVLGPLDLDLPAGRVGLTLAVEPKPEQVEASLRARLDRFDYGILARRLDPRSRQRGLISLDAELRATGPDLSSLSPDANGWIEIAARPERMAAGALELWATNILRAMLRLVSPFSQPQVNCLVGAFDVEEGLLESRLLLVDTTSMQILGGGHADFGTGAVRFEFRPRPKRSDVLSLAVPVVAQGTLPRVRTRIRPENPLRTVARQVGNALRIPLETLFGRRPPADGRPLCLAALEAVRESAGREGEPLGAPLLRCDSPLAPGCD